MFESGAKPTRRKYLNMKQVTENQLNVALSEFKRLNSDLVNAGISISIDKDHVSTNNFWIDIEANNDNVIGITLPILRGYRIRSIVHMYRRVSVSYWMK